MYRCNSNRIDCMVMAICFIFFYFRPIKMMIADFDTDTPAVPVHHPEDLWNSFSGNKFTLQELSFNAVAKQKITQSLFFRHLPLTHTFGDYSRILSIIHDKEPYRLHNIKWEMELTIGDRNPVNSPRNEKKITLQPLNNLFGLSNYAHLNTDFIFNFCHSTAPEIYSTKHSKVCFICDLYEDRNDDVILCSENVFQKGKFYSKITRTQVTQLIKKSYTLHRIIDFPTTCPYHEDLFGHSCPFYLGRAVKITFCIQWNVPTGVKLKTHYHLELVLEKINEVELGLINLEGKSSKERGFIDVLQPLNLCGLHCTDYLSCIS